MGIGFKKRLDLVLPDLDLDIDFGMGLIAIYSGCFSLAHQSFKHQRASVLSKCCAGFTRESFSWLIVEPVLFSQ